MVFNFVDAVESGNTVAFGIGGIVKDLIDEIIDACAEGNRHLSDMDELGGRSADDMHAKKF